MRLKPIALVIAVSVSLLLLLPAMVLAGSSARPAGDTGPNLLQNGDFEGGGDTWPLQDGIGEVQAAPSWRAYYVDIPPSYVTPPSQCYDERGKLKDYGCYWARPEFRDVKVIGQPNRVHGGERAQKYFSYGRMHEAGLMQHVTGIVSGTKLLFSIYIEAWMCSDPNACKGGYRSDAPTTMHMKVGIDPTGGMDWRSPNIVWSGEVDSFDRWTQFSVEAVAQSDSVTVFTHSRPEWDWARMNNDVYLDDASLVALDTPTPSPPSASEAAPAIAARAADQQSSAVAPVAHPQNVQRPDGSIVHVVQSGDTPFGIALAYGVTVDQIMQLNNLQPGDFLQIGQELVVKGPTNPPTPTPTLEPTAAPTAAAATPVSVAAAPTTGGLCVQAFNDRNGNGLYDGTEELVPDIQFKVMEGDTLITTYTTNGINEPHCFGDLAPRAYTVRIEPPQNYVPTTDEQVGVALAAGQTANVSFGTQPPSSKGQTRSVSAESGDTASLLTRYRGAIVGLCGVGVLLVAGVVGFVLISRRKV